MPGAGLNYVVHVLTMAIQRVGPLAITAQYTTTCKCITFTVTKKCCNHSTQSSTKITNTNITRNLS